MAEAFTVGTIPHGNGSNEGTTLVCRESDCQGQQGGNTGNKPVYNYPDVSDGAPYRGLWRGCQT